MLRSVSYAKSSDENRYILNSVYFNFSEGKLTLVATDGKRMALVSRDMKIEQEDEGNVILPAKTVGELEKLLSQGKVAKISFNERQVAFDIDVGGDASENGLVGSIYLVSKIVEGSYPNYKQVIPKEAEHRIKVDRELMLETVNRVAILTSDKQNSVKLTMSENSLEISTRSAEGDAKQAIEIEYSGPGSTNRLQPLNSSNSRLAAFRKTKFSSNSRRNEPRSFQDARQLYVRRNAA